MKYQYTCASIESLHKCESWRLNLFGSTLLNGQVVSCSLAIGCFKCHNLFEQWRGQVRAILLPSYTTPNMLVFEAITLCNIPKYVDFSVLDLQSDSPALGV